MYETINSWFTWLLGVLSLNVLAVVAVIILGFSILLHLSLLVFRNKCRAYKIKKFLTTINIFNISIGFVFLAVFYLYAGTILALPVVVVALVALVNFVFGLFYWRKCMCCCCHDVVDASSSKSHVQNLEQQMQASVYPEPKQIEKYQPSKAVILPPKQVITKTNKTKNQQSKPRLSPVKKEGGVMVEKKLAPAPEKSMAVEVSKTSSEAVAQSKPFLAKTVVDISPTHRIETQTSQRVEKTSTLDSSISIKSSESVLHAHGGVSARENSTQLGISQTVVSPPVTTLGSVSTDQSQEKQALREEYNSLSAKLDNIRQEKISRIGSNPPKVQTTQGFGKPGTHAKEKYDEEQVKSALASLKAAMDEMDGR